MDAKWQDLLVRLRRENASPATVEALTFIHERLRTFERPFEDPDMWLGGNKSKSRDATVPT